VVPAGIFQHWLCCRGRVDAGTSVGVVSSRVAAEAMPDTRICRGRLPNLPSFDGSAFR